MATITRETGLPPIIGNEEIISFLQKRGIDYKHWEIKSDEANQLIAKETLTNDEKEHLLKLLDDKFALLQKEAGYQARDLIVLHPAVPGLDEMLSKFDKVHYHTDVEVRYIIDGSGVFGFSHVGEKFLVHVSQGDFILVPRHINHWFYLDEKKRIKAVRYFQDTSGWVPNYVEEKASL